MTVTNGGHVLHHAVCCQTTRYSSTKYSLSRPFVTEAWHRATNATLLAPETNSMADDATAATSAAVGGAATADTTVADAPVADASAALVRDDAAALLEEMNADIARAQRWAKSRVDVASSFLPPEEDSTAVAAAGSAASTTTSATDSIGSAYDAAYRARQEEEADMRRRLQAAAAGARYEPLAPTTTAAQAGVLEAMPSADKIRQQSTVRTRQDLSAAVVHHGRKPSTPTTAAAAAFATTRHCRSCMLRCSDARSCWSSGSWMTTLRTMRGLHCHCLRAVLLRHPPTPNTTAHHHSDTPSPAQAAI